MIYNGGVLDRRFFRFINYLCALLLEIASGNFQAEVALLVSPAGTESSANEGRERSSLEQEDGEDDTKTETNGRLDEKVRQTTIPLYADTHIRLWTSKMFLVMN